MKCLSVVLELIDSDSIETNQVRSRCDGSESFSSEVKLVFIGIGVASKGFLGRCDGVFLMMFLIQLACEGDFAGP